jgi:hypothetical protein
MVSLPTPKKATSANDSLILYSELNAAQVRAVQRRIKAGELARVVPGIASDRPPEDWPALIARDRIRVLAALFPGAVLGHASAFEGGVPVDGTVHLNYGYARMASLPGLDVALVKGAPRAAGDVPMQGRDFYFPSQPRLLLENLRPNRGRANRSAGREAVEARLLAICDARGEEALSVLREEARALAPALGHEREFGVLDGLIGSILGTRRSQLTTAAGKARTAPTPYDHGRLALFEKLAAALRANPLKTFAAVATTGQARSNFAFLESYFSNFIEGTEFAVQDARAFVLNGKPIDERPKDSHDIIDVFRQALSPAWANQTLASGEAVLAQLRARHADQMAERPEVGPGEFKSKANRAGNTEFVEPALVRGTLMEGSRLLPSVPEGMARALLAMFLVAEVQPFADGNGRLARLVMNSELSVVEASRVIVPTLYREEYLDCLRVLTRDGEPGPYMAAMANIHEWTAQFNYENLDEVIGQMKACNAFERSRAQYKLLTPAASLARP